MNFLKPYYPLIFYFLFFGKLISEQGHCKEYKNSSFRINEKRIRPLKAKEAVYSSDRTAKVHSPIQESEQFGKTPEFKKIDNINKIDLSAFSAVFFVSPSCPECQFLIKEVLPELFSSSWKKLKIALADPDKRENLLYLIELEEKLKTNETAMPVLLCNGKLYHGKEKIESLTREEIWKEGTPLALFSYTRLQVKSKQQRIISSKANNSAITRNNSVFLKYSERLTPWVIIVAGLLDGINPCVFSGLIFFISLLYVSGFSRKIMLYIGITYTVASFIAYLLIGLGIFTVLKKVSEYSGMKIILNYGIAVILVIFGLISCYDAFVLRKKNIPDNNVVLRLPGKLKQIIHSIMKYSLKRRLLIPGVFISAALVTIIETVCTGQIYIPILNLLVRESVGIKWFIYLVLYNIMFTVPLICLFLTVYIGIKSLKLLSWSKKNAFTAKICMGIFFFCLAGIMLWMNKI